MDGEKREGTTESSDDSRVVGTQDEVHDHGVWGQPQFLLECSRSVTVGIDRKGRSYRDPFYGLGPPPRRVRSALSCYPCHHD